jgi:hypothetical protein
MKGKQIDVNPVEVSDHAVLRYLERAQGFNIEAVRSHIAKLCAPAASAGASTLRAEGLRFTISLGRKVVTVAPDRGICETRAAQLQAGART